jgi:3',5'-cyclic AMP phosphodiesterase CpdA
VASVRRYLDAVGDRLGADQQLRVPAEGVARHLDGSDDPLARVRAALPTGAQLAPADADGAPYLVRDPMVSVMQSVIEEKLQQARPPVRSGPLGWVQRLARWVADRIHPGRFTPEDPRWVLDVSQAWLERLATDTAPFNPEPARLSAAPDSRLVIFGDWGTGLDRARAVATRVGAAIDEALAQGRQVHAIHLGDVYYSGMPAEYQQRALACWPVTAARAAAGVTSWSLNGNHDMYSGGHGYFQTLLADPRFAHQHSADGRATSHFQLTAGPWTFYGLDTAWQSRRITAGMVGQLADPQADLVRAAAAGTERLVLLSHHQYLSVYSPSDLGPELGQKLGDVLATGKVRAWWWGHEHRCMGFRARDGIANPRCLGHGGVPTPLGSASTDPLIAWEERDTYTADGQTWRRFGYLVLDVAADHLDARYYNDGGVLIRQERLS